MNSVSFYFYLALTNLVCVTNGLCWIYLCIQEDYQDACVAHATFVSISIDITKI